MRQCAIDMRRYAGAVGVFVLLGVAAQPANANSEYDSSSLDGNLQNQCTAFSATISSGTSLVVSAECNKEGSSQGSVAATRQATSFDLSDDVVWNTTTQAFSWDATVDDNNNVTEKCTSVRGFSYSSADVTLQLTCTVDSASGGGDANADLALNGKLTVGTDGDRKRR